MPKFLGLLGSGDLCKCSISYRPALRCWLKMKVIKHASLIYLACFISSIMKYNYSLVTYILWSNAALGVFMNIIAPIQSCQWWGSSHLLRGQEYGFVRSKYTHC